MSDRAGALVDRKRFASLRRTVSPMFSHPFNLRDSLPSASPTRIHEANTRLEGDKSKPSDCFPNPSAFGLTERLAKGYTLCGCGQKVSNAYVIGKFNATMMAFHKDGAGFRALVRSGSQPTLFRVDKR